MGQLDEPAFEDAIGRGCTGCGARTLEIRSFLDQRLLLMLADPNDAGRWVHDGEKFVDGIYRIACASCARVVFESADCPRCHATGGLARALGETSRLAVPKRCPSCSELELLALALVPSVTKYTAGQTPKPVALAEFGEPGHHVVAFACESCDAATVTQACPLCDAPGPLRPRP
ncbi:MAG TPA: hypothetical protein VFQ53_33295 [Kofleriaceae bacterium]|nr:hypothetical protein [Kofleriaceae bacterium]